MSFNRLLYMVTVPISARSFLRGQLKFLKEHGYNVHVAASPAPKEMLIALADREGAQTHFVPLAREINLVQDTLALAANLYLMWKLRPHVTNVGTPKAGLIGGLAAVLTGVPARVYTLRGLRLETTSGPKRYLLLSMERLACASAHRVVCVSPSIRKQAIKLGIVSPEKAIVLRSGSSNGLDATRFLPSSGLQQQAIHLRATLNLQEGTPTIGFVGRLVRDKGIAELVEAFKQLHTTNPKLRLMLLGDYEEGDPVSATIRQTIETHPGIIRVGFVVDTAPYYQLMDVLALPTYREGYPNTPLEAAAAGKPVVASDATGAVDAVVDGVTGLTVPVGNAAALADALGRVLEDRELAEQLGQAGQERVLRDFQPLVIWQALDDLYQELLAEAQLRHKHKPRRTLGAVVGLTVLATPFLVLGRSAKKQHQADAKHRPLSKVLSKRVK